MRFPLSELESRVRNRLTSSLNAFGFTPVATQGGILVRHTEESLQRVWVEVDPEAGAGSLPCRITVNLQIELPKVNEIARDMVDDPKLIGGGNVTINLPLEFLLNKSDRATALRIDSSDEIDKVLRGVITALQGFGMPFLNDYATARGLVMQHERGDARIIKQPHWWIFVAASYLELGEKDRARQVLNSAYHLPGLRRRFSKAFDVVS